MALHKTYIVSAFQHVLSQNLPQENLFQEPGEPAVAPENALVFPEDIMKKIQYYKDNAILVEDFESWMAFLENVAIELDLNPAQDLENLASVLNQYRISEGQPPL